MIRVFLLFLAAALSCVAESSTNVIPSLVIKGRDYKNVHVTSYTPVDAIVVYDGGGMRAKWEELPESLQKMYGYDPVKAREYLAKKNQKKAAPIAESSTKQPQQAQPSPALSTGAQAVASPALREAPKLEATGEPHPIRVISIVATNLYARCLVSLDGSNQEILLDRLPPGVAQSFEGLYSFQTMLNEFERKVNTDKKKAEAENAAANEVVGATTARQLGEQMNKRRQAESDLVDVAREEKDLGGMKNYLKTLIEQNQKTAKILAAPTGKSLAGVSIWKCVRQVQ
jgi:hypothetical protein